MISKREGMMFDSPEAPIEGEVDKWGFTIKPTISDTECILMCLRNAPCGTDKKQVERIILELTEESNNGV